MYKIQVVNIHYEQDYEYIGRPSPLQNPIPISKHKTRHEVCDAYDVYFDERIHFNDPLILNELRRLHRIAKEKGLVRLGCYCKQKHKEVRCHGDKIKSWMENNYDFLEVLDDMTK